MAERRATLACTPDLRDVLREVLSQRRSIEDAHAWIINMLHQAERAAVAARSVQREED